MRENHFAYFVRDDHFYIFDVRTVSVLRLYVIRVIIFYAAIYINVIYIYYEYIKLRSTLVKQIEI